MVFGSYTCDLEMNFSFSILTWWLCGCELFPQVIKIKDIIPPPEKENFVDVYIVYELMDTDLHQVIRSSQALTEDHCQVCWSLHYLSASTIFFLSYLVVSIMR